MGKVVREFWTGLLWSSAFGDPMSFGPSVRLRSGVRGRCAAIDLRVGHTPRARRPVLEERFMSVGEPEAISLYLMKESSSARTSLWLVV
jgi:hypothetical protein